MRERRRERESCRLEERKMEGAVEEEEKEKRGWVLSCKTASFHLSETTSFSYPNDWSFASNGRHVVLTTRPNDRSSSAYERQRVHRKPDDTPFAFTPNDSAFKRKRHAVFTQTRTTCRLLSFLIFFHFSFLFQFKSIFHLTKYLQIIFKPH